MDITVKNYIIIFILLIIILILFITLTIILNDTVSPTKSEDLNDNNNNENDNIIIIPKIFTSIKILRAPYKMQYKEGEIFDKSGMIIKGIYDDNSQIYIDNYIIDKILPLTIYDTNIIISYKGKNATLNIKIINEEEIEIHQNLSKEKYTIDLINEDITRFEIEDSYISNWIISNEDNQNKIIKRNDSSRGNFLSGIDDNISNEVEIIFYINLIFNSEIIMYASYSQKEKWKNYDIDISSIYSFIIDENKIIEIDGNTILKSRQDITKWQIIKYKSFILSKGRHKISIKASLDKEIGSPNIDYIDFKTKEINEIPIEPDKEDMPSNDFHTFLQYQYLKDKTENISNYARGVEDLSRPKGNILDFSDSVKDSLLYILQISSSVNFDTSDTKIIRDLKEKQYIIKNLKLGQTIFYRASTIEENLEFSKIYKLTTNSLPPRNLDIPGVDNARDIGGYKTTLIENGIINQGLFYRTAEIDRIEEEGKKIVIDLGIKVEIDLRDEIYNRGPYMDGVKYIPITLPSAGERRWFDAYEEQYVKIFELITQADINPITIHCTHGADRTGIISFALLSLLGVEYDDIARDFFFTNFAQQGFRDINSNSNFKVWWNKLNKLNGETLAEKSKYFLMGKGIEESKLEHIRAIFINGYKEKTSKNNDEIDKLNEYRHKMFDKKFLELLDDKII